MLFTVEKPSSDDQCKRSNYHPLPGLDGYISTTVAKDTNAGSLNCPWQLAAQQGQRINISLIDFHPLTDTLDCIPVAYITEVKSHENRTVCKPNERNQHILISNSNIMHIQLVPSTSIDSQEALLLHYEGKVIVLLHSTMQY